MGKAKHKDLQPYLDYFAILRRLIKDGYLQMEVQNHEAFVTQPTLHAMSEGDNPVVQMRDGSLVKTARRLRVYAAWLSQEGESYLHKNFAVNVVAHDEPHDMIFTILFSPKRRLWCWRESVKVINYPKR